ncbi:MAG: IS66 family transposase [bacterium]|nr:IS66 family transposase [bacterium]
MELLTKDDLAQMNRPYFEKLSNESLIDVALNLRNFAVILSERLEQNSENSSKPPSSDNPYKKRRKKCKSSEKEDKDISSEDTESAGSFSSDEPSESDSPKRSPGKQPGAQGFWRSETPIPEETIPHYPEKCVACGRELTVPEGIRPYMGYYVFELEKTLSGIRIFCTLHHYYIVVCDCGHENKARPGEGFISIVEGRKKDLKLTEYVMVGPMLATFITALSVRYRMSRVKIREFLIYWYNLELSVGTVDRCIREAGVACFPVVEQLIEDLQEEDIVHLDETPWYEKGNFIWLWVAISQLTAVYHIGTRRKEELLKLITEAFIGWLISDGYGAYRDREKRQRCLAHLIRKAVALTGAVDEKAQKMGAWFLRELRGLIKTMNENGEDCKKKCSPMLARLKRVCNLGSESDHPKLRALAREILNDWDAVVAFVKNPGLPPTNNEAERALRHAVISRRISFGTRNSEGSRAYATLLSVIETCMLRDQDPWDYIAQTVTLGRKGIAPKPIPQ